MLFALMLQEQMPIFIQNFINTSEIGIYYQGLQKVKKIQRNNTTSIWQ